ncbi:MAG: hypothetical protein PHE24_05865 [Patescibacteria group bacterium]|nr:hypothetical protein [Patescibacteria group bacterium]
MKKLLFFAPVIVALLLLAGCTMPQLFNKFQSFRSGNYLGSDYKGNYVWGGAMNLAWNELNDNILHEKLQLKTTDKVALGMVDKFNNPAITKDDLDEASYYIKSGYGQETVDAINKESKAKFPDKSFGDLQIKLDPTGIISYAYFLKQVEYQTVFDKKDVSFNGQKVAGFYARGGAERGNVKIVKYENDDKFIVSLQLKDKSDQLILAKGYDMSDPQTVVKEINRDNQGNLATIDDADSFEAPKLQLDDQRDYNELINKYLANKGFENYYIAMMFENIKFNMDERGARVENEGAIGLTLGAAYNPNPVKPKNFILNKPYWVVMQRKNSQNPYFILGVNNTELMEKK